MLVQIEYAFFTLLFIAAGLGFEGFTNFDGMSVFIAGASCARIALKNPKLGWVGGAITIAFSAFMTLILAMVVAKYFIKTEDVLVVWLLVGGISLVMLPLADSLTKQAGLIDIVGPANTAIERALLRFFPDPKNPKTK